MTPEMALSVTEARSITVPAEGSVRGQEPHAVPPLLKKCHASLKKQCCLKIVLSLNETLEKKKA